MLTAGRPADARQPGVRRALAISLVEQVGLLRAVPAAPLRQGAPAWARYETGPWPEPHDPIFDFGRAPLGYAWLDDLATRAAAALTPRTHEDVVGHSDWGAGNVLFDVGSDDTVGSTFVRSAFDWDSLAARPEAVIAGMSAGSHTLAGARHRGGAPTPGQVAGFLADYAKARAVPFADDERRAASAAACWVLAYNARCEMSHPTAALTGDCPGLVVPATTLPETFKPLRPELATIARRTPLAAVRRFPAVQRTGPRNRPPVLRRGRARRMASARGDFP
jgi:hypothetical protein